MSMDQLKDICRVANLSHTGKKRIDLIVSLCENELTRVFASATFKSIKSMCRSRKLKVTGLKYQLVLRILEHDAASKTFIENKEDSFQAGRGKLSEYVLHRQLNSAIANGSHTHAYDWLAEMMDSIWKNTISFEKIGQPPLATFRAAESVFAVLIRNFQYLPRAIHDESDSLSIAINRLVHILDEKHDLLDECEKKAAVAWIIELDHILSEYMLGENSKRSLADLVHLIEKGSYPLSENSHNHERKSSKKLMKEEVKEAIVNGDGAYLWLLKTLELIKSDPLFTTSARHPRSAIRDAELIFEALVENLNEAKTKDHADNLTKALEHLTYILDEGAHIFMNECQNCVASEWIENLDFVRLHDEHSGNPKLSVKDNQIQKRNDHTLKVYDETIKTTKKRQRVLQSTRTPLRNLQNNINQVPSKAIQLKKTKPKLITSKKEIVYKKVTSIIRNSGEDSDFVYRKLKNLMHSILRQVNDYEALRLFQSAFSALIMQFDKIEHPEKDKDHCFTIAINVLGNVVKSVKEVLSANKIDEVLSWMKSLHKLTRPHSLGDSAETPLIGLIQMLEKVRAGNSAQT